MLEKNREMSRKLENGRALTAGRITRQRSEIKSRGL